MLDSITSRALVLNNSRLGLPAPLCFSVRLKSPAWHKCRMPDDYIAQITFSQSLGIGTSAASPRPRKAHGQATTARRPRPRRPPARAPPPARAGASGAASGERPAAGRGGRLGGVQGGPCSAAAGGPARPPSRPLSRVLGVQPGDQVVQPLRHLRDDLADRRPGRPRPPASGRRGWSRPRNGGRPVHIA